MGKSAPASPNPYTTANAQTAANKDSAIDSARLNAVQQYAPWGNTTYDYYKQGPYEGAPKSQTITLGPSEQQFYNTSGQIRNSLASSAQGILGQLPTSAWNPSSLPYNPAGLSYSGSVDPTKLGAMPSVGGSMIDLSKLGAMPNAGQSQIDISKLGPMMTPDQFSADADRVQQALYDRRMNLIQPELQQQRNASDVTLMNRGIPINSEVYNNEMNRVGTNEAEQAQAAANEAIAGRGAEQSRLYGMQITGRQTGLAEQQAMSGEAQRLYQDAMAGRQLSLSEQTTLATEMQRLFGNQMSVRQQGLGEQQALSADQLQQLQAQMGINTNAYNQALTARELPFNEASALIQGSPAMQTPQFQSSGGYAVAPPDIGGYINTDYQNRLNAYNTQQSQLSNGLFGLGSAALGFFGGGA